MRLRSKGALIVAVMMGIFAASPLLTGSMDTANAAAAPMEYNIAGYITPVDDLSSVYFIGSFKSDFVDTDYFYKLLDGPFPAGVTTEFNFTVSHYGYAPLSYTILARHGLAEDGVTVGSNVITSGASWDFRYEDGTQWEQQTFAALLIGSYVGYELQTFYATNINTLGAPMGSELSLVNFSNATPGGSAYAAVVPLPATLFLFGPGLIGLVAVRRKFNQ